MRALADYSPGPHGPRFPNGPLQCGIGILSYAFRSRSPISRIFIRLRCSRRASRIKAEPFCLERRAAAFAERSSLESMTTWIVSILSNDYPQSYPRREIGASYTAIARRGSNVYPKPRTEWISTGLAGSVSIFCRSRKTYTSTARSVMARSWPHTEFNNCSRLKTTPGQGTRIEILLPAAV